jgi:hypothetical protein
MKNVFNKSGIVIAFVFATSIFTTSSFGQNSKACEKIISQIYVGINQQNADNLLQYLSKDFSMAGQNGDLALEIFAAYITSIKMRVYDIKKCKEKQTNVLTIDYEAKFDNIGIKKSTFVFDKDSKLIKMHLLPIKY